MTLDTNKPTDRVMNEEIPSYIREDRVAINAVSGTGNVGATILSVGAGVSFLTVGADLGTFSFEVVILSGAGVAVLGSILGGTNGQVKVFVCQDNLIDFTDGAKAGGQFYLNHLPVGSNYAPQQDAVLALVNVGGDGGATTHGYWKELYRTNPVK